MEESTAKNVIESIKEVIYSRLKNRFTGAFILAWTVSNWKLFYVTVFVKRADLPTNKLDFIAQNYVDTNHLFWWPCLAATAVVVIAPILNGLSNNWNEIISSRIKELSMKIARKTPVDQIEHEQLIDKLKEIEEKHILELKKNKDDTKTERDRLSQIIVELNEKLEKQKADPVKKQPVKKVREKKEVSEAEKKRQMKRMSLELKTQTKGVIDQMAHDYFYNGTTDLDQIANRFINDLDKLKSELDNIITSYADVDGKVLRDELTRVVGLVEDSSEEVAKEINASRGIDKSLIVSALKKGFGTLYELFNQ
jgi:hypothetical protein